MWHPALISLCYSYIFVLLVLGQLWLCSYFVLSVFIYFVLVCLSFLRYVVRYVVSSLGGSFCRSSFV